MVEAGANEVSEEVLLEAMRRAQEVNLQLIELQEEIQQKIGKPKAEFEAAATPEEIKQVVVDFANTKNWDPVGAAKDERASAMQAVRKELIEAFGEQYSEKELLAALEAHMKSVVRERILDGTRPDGRKPDEIRPISCEVGLLQANARLGSVYARRDAGAYSADAGLDGRAAAAGRPGAGRDASLHAPLQLPAVLRR